jgi:hypothetical protein
MLNIGFNKEDNRFDRNTDEELESIWCTRYDSKLIKKRESMGPREIDHLKQQRVAILAELTVRDMRKDGEIDYSISSPNVRYPKSRKVLQNRC